MWVLRNNFTDTFVDPRSADFSIDAADLGFSSWDEAFAANSEVDLVEGHTSVNLCELRDSETNEFIREATDGEVRESIKAGHAGHIEVDGRRCYVSY